MDENMNILDEMVAPDLYSVTVELEPVNATDVSAVSGHNTYATFLNLLRTSSPSLTEELHNSDSQKPFTVSLLQRRSLRKAVNEESVAQPYSLRVTFLKGGIFAHFLDGALKWGGRDIQMGSAVFKIERVDTLRRGLPSPSFHRYEDMANNAANSRQIELEFLSPTAFRSGGKRNVVFPAPELVFGSYLNRWQAFSPLKLDDTISSWFDRIVVARYRLETHILNFSSYQEVGFTGRCRYELDKNTPEEVALALNGLADFAFYCGTGAKTTMGMGQTKKARRARNMKAGRESSIVPEKEVR